MIERSVSIQDKPITQLEITKDLLEGFLYGKRPIQLVDVQGRRKRKWEGGEEESTRKLQSLWCEECCKYIQGECAIHHSSQPKLTYAVGSFPPEVRLCTSSIPEYTYGACAAKPMPRGTWIGPYEGRRVNLNQMPKDKDNTFGWEIYENGRFSHFIDGSDETISSWMRFIRCARQKAEQNMSVIQYEKNIYYYATRDIEVGEEMLVWYHESYYQFWGVPLVLGQELDQKNGPPVPPGILQPLQVPQATSPSKTNSSPGKPEILQQYEVQKSFLFPKQTPSLKRHSPPLRFQLPPVSPHLPPKLDSSAVSPVAQHPSLGGLVHLKVAPTSRPYPPPDVSTSYPQLSKGTTPYLSLPKNGAPYPIPAQNTIPCPTMPPQSSPYSYQQQPRYPPVPPDANIYQVTSAQYQPRPSQPSTMAPQQPFLERQGPVVHSMGPPNVQLAPVTHMSSPPPQRVQPTSPQRVPATQVPQSLTSEIPRVGQPPTNLSPQAVQQATLHSSRGQRVKAYYEIDNYRSSDIDRSSTSSESDQWGKGEVKENMPLDTEDHLVLDPDFKNDKLTPTLKATPLQNLNSSIHNKRPATNEQEKQHNQVSSTVRTGKDQEVSWTCGQCGEMFAQQVTLRMHVCAKAPENPYHCGHCTNTFATSSELREHVVTHSNERPFKCGFCGRSFAGATTLGNHMRTHTGQRPYECKVCGQTFAIATQLSRHLRPPGECGLRQKEVNNYNQSVDIAVEQ